MFSYNTTDKENVISARNSNKPLRNVVPHHPNVMKKGLSANSSHTDDVNAQRELKKIKVSMVEKDKQLAYLEQQLSVTQSRVSELEVTSDKMRRSEKVSKMALSSKVASVRRQDVLLKQVSDRLSSFATKDENKARRRAAAKQELHDELERVGKEFHNQ
mgnify:CR=1 FL=1